MIGYPIDFKANPRAWWKFRSNNCIQRPSRSSDIWVFWGRKFQKYIQSYPLTKENAIYFLDNHISNIDFNCFSSIMVIDSIKPVKFKMGVEKNLSLEEKYRSVIHETVHGFYRFHGSLCAEDEKAIETEAIRFCNAESVFIQDYVNNLLQRANSS